MGVGNLDIKKFYIVWDEMELKILLPDTNKPETIKRRHYLRCAVPYRTAPALIQTPEQNAPNENIL